MRNLLPVFLLLVTLTAGAQQLDPDFPQAAFGGLNGPGGVQTLAVDGDILYVGGNFQTLGGQNRTHLGAIDLTTGSVTGWKAVPDKPVKGLTIANGVVYVWGSFTTINGMARNSLAALDAATGAVTSFNPTISFPGIPGMQTGSIEDVVVKGDTLFLAGYFLGINGQSRLNLAAITTDGVVLDWHPATSSIPINRLAVSDQLVYCAGPFYDPRNGLLAFDRWSDQLSVWDPDPDYPGNTFGPMWMDDDGAMWVSGPFSGLKKNSRPYLGKVDANTGTPVVWDAGFSFGNPVSVSIRALASDNEHLYVGGSIEPGQAAGIQHLGRLNHQDGQADDWHPAPDKPVLALVLHDHHLIVGGQFGSIVGQGRSLLARFDLNLSAVETDHPSTSWSVFPNPASGWVRIQGVEEAAVIRVLDITGREVMNRRTIHAASVDLDLRHVPPGPCVVEVTDRNGSGRQQVILH